MRVAHFVQRFPPAMGGSEAWFARLSLWLQERGHQVSVWTSTAIDLSAFWSAEGRSTRSGIRRENGLNIRRYSPALWFARRHMLKVFSWLPFARWQCLAQPHNPILPRMWLDSRRTTEPCDVVHATAFPYGWPLLCALNLARRNKAPFLLTPFMHFGDPDDPRDRTRRVYTSRAMRYLLHAADAIFVQTRLELEEVAALGVHRDRLILQGMGVDPAACTGGDRERARGGWHVGGSCVIGHLATLSRAKGTIDLLRAARRKWNDGADFVLVLAGSKLPEFNRFWQNFEPKERVRLLGQLTDEAKKDFFAGIDAFCLPSRSDSFGLVLTESWANRKPVIAYRSGGVGELVQHGDDGLLVNCGDLIGLGDALVTMRRADLRDSLGMAGYSRIPTEFLWEDKLAKVEECMGGLAGASASPPKSSAAIPLLG